MTLKVARVTQCTMRAGEMFTVIQLSNQTKLPVMLNSLKLAGIDSLERLGPSFIPDVQESVNAGQEALDIYLKVSLSRLENHVPLEFTSVRFTALMISVRLK